MKNTVMICHAIMKCHQHCLSMPYRYDFIPGAMDHKPGAVSWESNFPIPQRIELWLCKSLDKAHWTANTTWAGWLPTTRTIESGCKQPPSEATNVNKSLKFASVKNQLQTSIQMASNFPFTCSPMSRVHDLRPNDKDWDRKTQDKNVYLNANNLEHLDHFTTSMFGVNQFSHMLTKYRKNAKVKKWRWKPTEGPERMDQNKSKIQRPNPSGCHDS